MDGSLKVLSTRQVARRVKSEAGEPQAREELMRRLAPFVTAAGVRVGWPGGKLYDWEEFEYDGVWGIEFLVVHPEESTGAKRDFAIRRDGHAWFFPYEDIDLGVVDFGEGPETPH